MKFKKIIKLKKAAKIILAAFLFNYPKVVSKIIMIKKPEIKPTVANLAFWFLSDSGITS